VLLERTCAKVGPITNTAGEGSRSNWRMDRGGMLWPMSTCLDTSQIGNANKGTHSLYSGTIHEPDVAASALWVYGSVLVVLLERTCAKVGPITNTAGDGSRSNWRMDGGGVLWPMLICLDTSQIGNANKGTHSVSVVLLERTCGSVRPIANMTIAGS
jgi:hypothetical protein